jgi:hypothetical protein
MTTMTTIENEINAVIGYDQLNQKTSECMILSVRDWGTWEFPSDYDGEEEDEEDYDYEELSEESLQELSDKFSKLEVKYPDFSFDFQTEEKNWITFIIRLKEVN